MSRKSVIFLSIAIVLAIVMAILLDATFTEWVSGFVTIFTLLGGNAVRKKIKERKGNQTQSD